MFASDYLKVWATKGLVTAGLYLPVTTKKRGLRKA